ncbi:MAG: hypothetical protein WCK29_03465 [archaeon]
MNIKENDIVMCTVKNVEGTTVFVDMEDNIQGSIVFSEVAAGRIRNIREYVSPSKKIVCKVLKIYPDHIELSLRRVTAKERDEISERYKKEKMFEGMLKAISPDYKNIITEIRKEYELYAFFEQVKENNKLIEKYVNKKEAESFIKVLQEKKDKEKEVKKTFSIKSFADDGINEIKDILATKDKKMQIAYLGSSQFSITYSAIDYKDADNKVNEFLAKTEKIAKEKKMIFEIIERK